MINPDLSPSKAGSKAPSVHDGASTPVNEKRTAPGSSSDETLDDEGQPLVPQTAAQFAEHYLQSPRYATVQAEIKAYNEHLKTDNPANEFKQAVYELKGPGARRNSPYQVGFLAQVVAIARRQAQLK